MSIKLQLHAWLRTVPAKLMQKFIQKQIKHHFISEKAARKTLLPSWGPWGITLIGKIEPLSIKTLLPSPAALTSLSYQFAALCTDTAESTGVSSSVYVFTRMRLLNRRDSRLYTIWSRGTGSIYGSLCTTPLLSKATQGLFQIFFTSRIIQHFRAGHWKTLPQLRFQ